LVGFVDQFSFGRVACQAAWTVEDSEAVVGILMDPHPGLDVVVAMAIGRNLRDPFL
jgi:hypothetical protein